MTNVVHPEGVQVPPQAQNFCISVFVRCRWLGEWWNGLSEGTQTCLIFLLSMLLTAVWFTVVFCLYGPSNKPDDNTNKQDLVLKELAAYYRKNLDEKVQPCEDFYGFVCNNLRREFAKENNSHFDMMNMMEKSVRLSLDDLLTKPLNTSDSPLLKQMKTFHQACINTTKVDAEGIEPVLTLLKEIGGWPLLTDKWVPNENWEDIVASINRAGFAIEFPYYLYRNPVPGHSAIVTMILAPLLRGRHHRILPDRNQTIGYVKRIAALLNATNVRIEKDIKNCMAFESELYQITNSVTEDKDLYMIDSLIRYNFEIPWDFFFRNVFVSTSMKVQSTGVALLTHTKYSFEVAKLLNKTSVKIIRNYMVLLLIEEAIPVLPEEFREARKVFEHRMGGEPRNLGCLETLIDKAPVSVGYLFIDNYFDGPAKNKSHGMIKSVERQAHRFFDNINWTDSDAKMRMRERLIKLKAGISHPDDIADVMEELEFRSNDMTFANYRRLASADRTFKYNRLRNLHKDFERIIPFQYATDAEAIYDDATHIMAAVFQRPFFSTVQPMYLNYGGIGFVIAQEIARGLDILSVCESKWCWGHERLRDRKECMEELYGKYVVKQITEKVDGRSTVSENIGDLIGLKLAYRAYEEYIKGSNESSLPGFNYTERQWFWINAATTLCSFDTDAGLRNSIATDKRSPAEARVNVAFANIEEFSRDFACQNTSRKNSTHMHRCTFE